MAERGCFLFDLLHQQVEIYVSTYNGGAEIRNKRNLDTNGTCEACLGAILEG